MSTETTSTTTTTTARTMRVAVTGSPFTARRDHSSDPPKPQSPPWTPDQDWSLAGYLKASQPRKPGSPGQHRPQLRHRIAHLRARRQIIHLPHSPPIQKRLSHPNHRHLNRIHPPPPKRSPHLTLQPRLPRPFRHQRLPTPEGPPVLHHPKLRMNRRSAHLQINRRLARSLNPKERFEVRQPPHPRLRPNLPTWQLHPPHCLKHLSKTYARGGHGLFKAYTLEPGRRTTPIRTMDSPKCKEQSGTRAWGWLNRFLQSPPAYLVSTQLHR